MIPIRGCGTALVTPFQPSGDLDLSSLRSLVEWQISQSIDFLVPCGSTGEAQTMSEREREQVVATVLEVTGGRVPVMAGATSNDTAKAVAETKRMCALGVDAILSACPYYNRPTPEGLYRHFMAVADAATRPVCLYNIPGRTAVNLTPPTVLRLVEHPNIAAIKESSGDLQQVMQLLRARPEGFAVLSGDDWAALPMIAAGGDGLISVTSNEVPALMRQLVAAALRGDFTEARRLHYRALPLMQANFLETNPCPVKAALHLMCKIENVLRLPLVPVSQATEAALRPALLSAGVEGL